MKKTSTARSPLYFGWYVVAAVTFIAFVNTGSRSSFGIFVIPMSEEFGWSRFTISAVAAIGAIVGGAAQPILAHRNGEDSVAEETEVWISEGWAERFGISEERTGLGDTTEQVASFRVPRDQVLGYAAAAHRAIVERVLKIAPERFDQQIESLYGDPRPVWRIFAGVIGDSTEHVGQINYLRGMTAGLGWR